MMTGGSGSERGLGGKGIEDAKWIRRRGVSCEESVSESEDSRSSSSVTSSGELLLIRTELRGQNVGLPCARQSKGLEISSDEDDALASCLL